jgi:phage terminase large subunit-like protein
MVEFCRANMKTAQGLLLMITNSGVYNTASVAWHYHEYSQAILEQRSTADHFFSFVCGLDRGDSWQDKKVWKKANPMLGISVSPRLLEEQVLDAKGMPSKQSLVRRLHFCEWVESADPWITKEVWDANAGKVDVASLRGKSCYGGLDLSKRIDLTAFVLVFPQDDGTKDVLVFAWTPEDGIEERSHIDGAPYSQWVDDGVLLTTPGKTIDYAFVAEKIGKLTAQYDIQAVAFDRAHFDEMERALNLANVDLKCMDHQQGFVGMNPAIEAAEEDLLNGRLRHGGNPLLTWAVFNVKIDKNAQGLRTFVKQKQTGRIDPAVSLAMACNMAANYDVEPQGSYAVTVI